LNDNIQNNKKSAISAQKSRLEKERREDSRCLSRPPFDATKATIVVEGESANNKKNQPARDGWNQIFGVGVHGSKKERTNRVSRRRLSWPLLFSNQ
jgi:hypothetical protein